MKPAELILFLRQLEKLKCVTRHSVTSSGRTESVAEHSWRLAVMAMLLRDEFPGIDNNKLIKMCLVHDWAEAITGDVPAFKKTAQDEATEAEALQSLLATLPEPQRTECMALFAEMDALVTPEARLCRALDKMEALIQHNEASIRSWLPLEHEMQLTYGDEESAWFSYTRELREAVRNDSQNKINKESYGVF